MLQLQLEFFCSTGSYKRSETLQDTVMIIKGWPHPTSPLFIIFLGQNVCKCFVSYYISFFSFMLVNINNNLLDYIEKELFLLYVMYFQYNEILYTEQYKLNSASAFSLFLICWTKCFFLDHFITEGELTLEEFIEGARGHPDIMEMLKTIMDLTPVLEIIVEGRQKRDNCEQDRPQSSSPTL